MFNVRLYLPPPILLGELYELGTPVFTGDGEGGSDFAVAAAAGAASGFDFGVDPNIDPELALALRVSLEEERARQEAAARRAAEEASRQEKGEVPSSNAEDATTAEYVNISGPEENKNASDEMDDENPEETQAMSIDISGSDLSVGDAEMTLEITEDQELILALEMSMQEGEDDHQSAAESLVSKVLKDQAVVSSILASLPGVDPDDPSVQDILASLRSHFDKKDEDEED